MEPAKLKSLTLIEENDKYYLSAVYRVEDDNGTWELSYPRIELTINKKFAPLLSAEYGTGCNDFVIDLGFGDLPLREIRKGVYAEKKLIEEKIHDMTVSEIEKALGYKVRIIEEEAQK